MNSQLTLFQDQPKPPLSLKSCHIIYTPKGRAREYAPLACNVYRGCDHRCEYCYAPSATRRAREDFQAVATRGPGFLRKVQLDAAKYQANGVTDQVMLSFTCDPYCTLDVTERVTRYTIKILHAHGLAIQVLTKGGSRALRDLDLFADSDAFASTLTFLDEGRSLKFEPGAATPADRLATIQVFHAAGIPTWVSLEPVLDSAEALLLINAASPYTDLFKVGKLNYHPLAKSIDWRRFAQNAISLLKSLGYSPITADQAKNCNRRNKGYYIKKDLLAFLE
jgi:DNA repair photolyase